MGRGPTQEYYQVMNDNYIEGTLTCLKPEVIRQKISPEFPLVLNIEPTNDCNAGCYYCPRDKMVAVQGKNYLSLEVFRFLIDQIGDRKLIMLNLHKDGEPLLHKDLPQMVAYVKKKNAAQVIHLNTNGTLLNSATGKGIIGEGIDDITVSVDAAHEETYRQLKNLKNLTRLEENIKRAIDFRNKIDSSTKIRVKIMEFADVRKEEIELFHKKWTGIADEVQVTGVHSWSGAIDNFEVTDEQTPDRYPCALLWYMLAINSNGKVSVCNVDWDYSGVIGNIHHESIHDLWNHGKLKSFRKAHLKGSWNCPHVCQDCVVWVSVGNIWDFLKTKKEFI